VSAARLSPEGARRWLLSLSIDLRATAVLDAAGAVLAGDAALGARAAQALTEAAPGGGPAEVREGDLLAVRGRERAVAAVVGPLALERLARCDLVAVAEALDGT